MYFTGERASDIEYFREAFLINSMVTPTHVKYTLPARDSLNLNHYTFKYVELIPEKAVGKGDSLYIDFYYKQGGIWKNQIVFYDTPNNFSVVKLSDWHSLVIAQTSCSKILLVVSNTSPDPGNYTCDYQVSTKPGERVDLNPVPVPCVLGQNYPNPFNAETMITYSITKQSYIRLYIVNINGQIVSDYNDRLLSPGYYTETFYGNNLSNGTYIIVLDSGDRIDTRKMTLVK